MKRRLFSFALALLMTLGMVPAIALPTQAASPYTDLYVESLYFTDADGLVQIDPIGRKGMLPRVAISKKESRTAFAGKLLVEATSAGGAVVAAQTITIGDASIYHTETVFTVDRTVFVGTAMDIPATATDIRVKYLSADGSEQYGNTAYWNPVPDSEGYVGEIVFPEPFKSLMAGKFTISKEAGIRRYSTTMSAETLYDRSGATEIFLSTQVNYAAADVKARTGLVKAEPITGRNFADNYKAGKYKNPDGSTENDFIFTLVDDFYSGTLTATGANIHTIPLNNFGYNNKLGSGVFINALIRSGSPSGFTWMGSIKRQSDTAAIETKWTKMEGYDNVYYTVQTGNANLSSNRVYTLFDFETRDEYGIPRPYVLADVYTDAACTNLDVNASLAAVNAADGTFFQSADLKTIYCNPREGDKPEDIVLQWYDSFLSNLRHNGNYSMQTIVFEDIGFMPRVTDHTNNQFYGGDFDKAVFGFMNCKFSGGAANTLGMTGKYTAYLNNCVAAYGFRDNFNYHGVTVENDGSRVIEVNCISYMNGDFNRIYNPDHPVNDSANSNNASTAHDGMYMLRVGGRYWNSQGHHVGDTGTKMTLNVGIEAYDITLSPSHAHAFGIGKTAQGWVIDCYAAGTRLRYAVGSGATNTRVLDLCGHQTCGIDGNKYTLPTLTWAQIAAGEWNADESVAPDIGGGDNTGGGGSGGGNTGGDNTGGGNSGITPTPGVTQDTYNAVADFSATQGAKNWFYKFFHIGEYGMSRLQDLSYQSSSTYWNNGTGTGQGQIRVNGNLLTLEPGNIGDGALVFCAPYSGKISLSMQDGKITMQEGCADVGQLKIFKNDTQIYPATGWLSLGSGQDQTFVPMEIEVKEGDLIIFRANKGVEETSNATKNNSGDKFRLNPIIIYTEKEEAAGVASSAAISVGATYGIHVYLTPTGAVTGAGVKIGDRMLAGELQTDGRYKVTVATAYARNLLGTSVPYHPYYTTAQGTVVAAEAVTANAKDLLETYVTGNYTAAEKALAQAALDYATVAEAYFANGTVDSALADRLSAYDSAITGATAGTTVVTADGSAHTFRAATLQLNDTIHFVLAVGAVDGAGITALPEGYKIVVGGTNVMPDDFKIVTLDGTNMLAASITGVPESEFAETQTFLLQDASGNTLATLTYSVKDFCVRAFAGANDLNKHMIRAIFAIGEAAAAYEA